MTYETVLKQLQAEGKTYDEMQAITGASKGTISYWLGKDQKAKTLNRTSSSRGAIDAYLQHLKETTPCVDCGHYYSSWNMQFDHLPQFVKQFNISRYRDVTQDLDRIKAEIAKCDLVCGNCHSDRSHYRRVEARKLKALYNKLLEHGHGEVIYSVNMIIN